MNPETADGKYGPQLRRELTFADATSLVIGIVIGTGVFLKAAVMAQAVGRPSLVLAAWVGAGLLSLAGALSYAELGALLPEAGGEYVYLREAYGDTWAFLFGWMRLTVGSTGTIASLAVGFSTFLYAVIPNNHVWWQHTFFGTSHPFRWQFGVQQATAVVVILAISAINCAGVALGGRIQSVITASKIVGIAVIVGGVFIFGHPQASNFQGAQNSSASVGMSSFGIAMLAALWAYDGWNQMPMVAGEVRHADRNVPRALIVGMIVVIALYTAVNFAYFAVLPFNDVATSSSTLYRDAPPVATKAAMTFLKSGGAQLISIVFLVSALGALHGSILTTARVPFAMARDGLFFSRFQGLSKTAHAPVLAIAIQAVWSSVLAISGTFDQLTDYVIFSSWVFYGLVASSVFVLRRKMPNAPRPYRTLGYPVIPMVFIAVACWLVLNTLQTRPAESGAGIVLVALGLPFYAYFRRTRRTGRQGYRES